MNKFFYLIPLFFNIVGFVIYVIYGLQIRDNLNPLSYRKIRFYNYSIIILMYVPFVSIVIIDAIGSIDSTNSTDKDKGFKKIPAIVFSIWLFIMLLLIIFKEEIWRKGEMFQTEELNELNIDDEEYDQETGKKVKIEKGSEKYKTRETAAQSERNNRISIRDRIYK